MTAIRVSLALIVLTACIPTPPAPPAPHEPMSVAAPMAQTWDAVIDVFATANIPIKAMERASGFIATDAMGARGLDGVADCGSDGISPLQPAQGSFNVLVRGDTTASSVRVTATWTHLGSSAGLTPVPAGQCSTSWKFETELETKVKTAAEAKKKK